jgi:Predicted transcriptional regulators
MDTSFDTKIPLSTKECTNRLAEISDALYVIGGKWKLRIIVALSEGPKRFNELQRVITGISAKVLSNELKDLELNGFIKRTVYTDAIPVMVEYERTEYADTLNEVLAALQEWGANHRKKIRER